MGNDVVELVLSEHRSVHGSFREPGFVMAEVRLHGSLTCEDLQKALLCGHLTTQVRHVAETKPPAKTTSTKRGRRKSKAT